MAIQINPTPLTIRARMREAEQAARNLIARAAYIEKRAARARVSSAERENLYASAQELRTAADVLVGEISELSRELRARAAA